MIPKRLDVFCARIVDHPAMIFLSHTIFSGSVPDNLQFGG
jgi:hypothetical protein